MKKHYTKKNIFNVKLPVRAPPAPNCHHCFCRSEKTWCWLSIPCCDYPRPLVWRGYTEVSCPMTDKQNKIDKSTVW